jgi:acid stress chaperone HdeB
MRTACAVALLALFAATPASAQKIDVSTIKCEEFIKSGKDSIGNIMMWLSGYYSGEDDEAIIDFDKMAATARSSASSAPRTRRSAFSPPPSASCRKSKLEARESKLEARESKLEARARHNRSSSGTRTPEPR